MSSILIRRANMVPVGNSPRLPAGYTELAYLQTDGNAYIDTGVKPVSNYERVVAKFSATKSYNDTQLRIFGSKGTSAYSIALWPYNSANPFGYICVGTTYYLPNGQNNPASTELNHVYEMDVTASGGTASGTYCGSSFTGTYSRSIPTNVSITLFKMNGLTGSITFDGTRIYSFQLYVTQGVMAFDGVPAMRDSDSEVGMYDLISNTFLTNPGSGTFNYGTL